MGVALNISTTYDAETSSEEDDEADRFLEIAELMTSRRWIDLVLLSGRTSDTDEASAIVVAASECADRSIVASCLLNMRHISSIAISPALLYILLTKSRSDGPEHAHPSEVTAQIAAQVAAIGMINRYRDLVEKLLTNTLQMGRV